MKNGGQCCKLILKFSLSIKLLPQLKYVSMHICVCSLYRCLKGKRPVKIQTYNIHKSRGNLFKSVFPNF